MKVLVHIIITIIIIIINLLRKVLEDERLSTFLNQKEMAKVLSIFYINSSKTLNMGCRDSSAVNSTGCSSREPRLDV